MGGTSSSSQSQSSSLTPYNAATPALNGLLGTATNLSGNIGLNPAQSGAINQIEANSAKAPDYSAPINSGTLGLLNGGGATTYNPQITGNLTDLASGILGTTASGANIGGNSALTPELNQIATDTTNGINSSWAAAGRGGSPGQATAIARGVAQGEAPVIAQQYNTDTGNALNAAGTLYNAGNTTYGMLGNNIQTGNTNFTNGVGSVSAGLNAIDAAPNATLAAASQATGIPIAQLTTLLGAVSPVAAQFGTQTGNANGTNTMSGAQQFGLLSQGAMNAGKFLFGG